ncbi:chromosomal replication initiator protein DnaA [Anaerorhabdus sp.]|uniref:chromosomal replication initiator protein DnaA n=2 Tax=Anaerorhabdus sp. TaxID=1872524 RepID=UPI002B21CBBB|nr:chromosomal replication initiator protein DnaA [Anaerorhabdus sp.]MEA4875550.1 chromosomal replication initiator protein DnaA [Anaerorhabdus sp.]
MTSNTFYLNEIWSKTLESIGKSGRVDNFVFDNFYKESNLVDLSDKKALVSVSSFIHKTLLMNEIDLISTTLEDILESTNKLNCEIILEKDLNKFMQENQTFSTEDLGTILDESFESSPLREDRTFENFVVGDCNRESHSAALACAYNPANLFNPLFIYGNSGLGKSHLLCAIGNYVKKNEPSKRVYYTDSNKFVDNVVNSIKMGKIDAFKKYMYSVDVLLIDDIQFIAGKEKSHEIFFSIFNELVNNRKQICIASDRLPTEIKGLEDRLISRFSSGLSVGIDSPEFETSLAILKMKMSNSAFEARSIDEEALAFIASNFNRDVRQLEGALNRVLFYAIEFQKDDGKIQFDTATNALRGQVLVSDKSGITVRKIIKCVSEYYGLTKQQLTSKTRTKNISTARQIAMFMCRKLLDLPYIKIGEEFGGRDHSTVMSSCEKVEKQSKSSGAYLQALNEIEKIIKS